MTHPDFQPTSRSVGLALVLAPILLVTLLTQVLGCSQIAQDGTQAPTSTSQAQTPSTQPSAQEDQPGWDCQHQGNGICGPVNVYLSTHRDAVVTDSSGVLALVPDGAVTWADNSGDAYLEGQDSCHGLHVVDAVTILAEPDAAPAAALLSSEDGWPCVVGLAHLVTY